MTTFVSVGNACQPFYRLLSIVEHLTDILPKPIVVQHGSTSFRNIECVARKFVEMAEFVKLVNEANLLIFHAGAGSIIHAAQLGKKPIVMPRLSKYKEHIDDHQLEFAEALSNEKKVVMVQNMEQTKNAVLIALSKCSSNLQVTKSKLIEDVEKNINKYLSEK